MASECGVRYGQVVVGAPGAGKTTYCRVMQQFLSAQNRPTLVVNVDPANDLASFEPDVDVACIVTVSEVMTSHNLGPNGALMFCMKFIADNIDHIITELDKFPKHYVLFDFPGQVELYTHDRSVPAIIKHLVNHNYRLVAVNLVDAHHCNDPGKFVSMVLTCLSVMLHLALPHINVLSKVDMAERHGSLLFGLDFYTEVLDLQRLVTAIDDHPFLSRHRKLTCTLADVIERYSLVSFQPLAANDRTLLAELCRRLDIAAGFVFTNEHCTDAEKCVQSMLSCAMSTQHLNNSASYASDKYIHPTDSPHDNKR